MGTTAAFPGSIKTFDPRTDLVDVVEADDVNSLYAEVDAIEEALGVNPAGTARTVADRLTAIETDAFFPDAGGTVSGNVTYTGSNIFEQWRVTSPSSIALAGTMTAQIGDTGVDNLAIDATGIQARDAGAVAPLRLNPLGGPTDIGGDAAVGGALTATGAATVSALTAQGAVNGRTGSFPQGGQLGVLAVGASSAALPLPLYLDGPVTPGNASGFADPALLALTGTEPWYFRTNGHNLDVVNQTPTNLAGPYLLRLDDTGDVTAAGKVRGTNVGSVHAGVTRSNNAQPIPNSQWTEVGMDSVSSYQSDFDTSSQQFVVASDGYSRFYTLVAGTLLITARVNFVPSTTGLRGIRIITAGGSVIAQWVWPGSFNGGGYGYVSAQSWHPAQVNYYFVVQVYQSSGGELDAQKHNGLFPYSVDATLIPG